METAGHILLHCFVLKGLPAEGDFAVADELLILSDKSNLSGEDHIVLGSPNKDSLVAIRKSLLLARTIRKSSFADPTIRERLFLSSKKIRKACVKKRNDAFHVLKETCELFKD